MTTKESEYSTYCISKKSICPKNCLSSSCPNLNLGNYEGPEGKIPFPENFCSCPHRHKINFPKRNFMVRLERHRKINPDKSYPDGDYCFSGGWLNQKHPYGYDVNYFTTKNDAISVIERYKKENPQEDGYWITFTIYELEDVTNKPKIDYLTILRKWVEAADCGGDASNYIAEVYGKGYGFSDTTASIAVAMIDHVRKNPLSVIERGKKEGWWRE